MRQCDYECAVVINAALDDVQIDPIIEKIKLSIQQNGGNLTNLENWGRKRLAYMIKKHKIGYYVFFRFNAPTDAIIKLERMLKLDEFVIRFLTIKLDKKAVEYLEKHQVTIPEIIPDEITIHDVPVLQSKVADEQADVDNE